VTYRTGPKTGILTFHRCINYGSYWQAKCLAEGLTARGLSTTILDHHSRRVSLAELRCAYQPLLPSITQTSDLPLYRNKIEKFFQAFEALPLSAPFSLAEPEEMEHFDTVVVGSDEVWNLLHPWYGKCPLFYGDGLRTERLISYAASFGNYPAAWGLSREWSVRLQRFDAISVRDENAQTLLRYALHSDPLVVLDPCLQFIPIPEERIYHHIQGPYLAVYGHHFSAPFIHKIKKWAAQQKLQTISIGYRSDWTDESWIDADPHDFAHFISGAAAVATNFFHGCVFSLRYQKPFVCEVMPYRSLKVTNLLYQLGAEGHLLTEDNPLPAARLTESLDPQILQKIDHYRQCSNEFLNNALGVQELRVA
jgi:hypothetical protein